MKSPGRLTAMPSQIVLAERAPIGRSRGERVDVGGARLRLHAHHAHALERAGQREADAAREPAAAERHHDQLQRQAPGARARARSSPGPATTSGWSNACTARQALGLGQALRLGARLVVAAVHEAHLAAVLAHRRHLRERRLLRHHEHRVRPRLTRGERHRLGVVAGAGRHHARVERLARKPADHVRGAARLERAGELEVLGLQQHARAHAPRQLPGRRAAASRARGPRAHAPRPPRRRRSRLLQGQRPLQVGLCASWPPGRTRLAFSRTPRCSAISRSASSNEVAQVAVPRHWEKGEVIFREGDVGDTCYLLRTGAVVLTREHQDGRMVALAELRAGDAVRRAGDVPRRDALGHGRGDRGHHRRGAPGHRRPAADRAATPTSR